MYIYEYSDVYILLYVLMFSSIYIVLHIIINVLLIKLLSLLYFLKLLSLTFTSFNYDVLTYIINIFTFFSLLIFFSIVMYIHNKVTTYCGHGIGELFHTSPNIPHYPKNKAKGTMQVGHIFTIEPMINLGDHRDVLWPDQWTAVTYDGSRSAQFEHTMLVTENGCELLTARVNEPIDRIEWDRMKFQR